MEGILQIDSNNNYYWISKERMKRFCCCCLFVHVVGCSSAAYNFEHIEHSSLLYSKHIFHLSMWPKCSMVQLMNQPFIKMILFWSEIQKPVLERMRKGGGGSERTINVQAFEFPLRCTIVYSAVIQTQYKRIIRFHIANKTPLLLWFEVVFCSEYIEYDHGTYVYYGIEMMTIVSICKLIMAKYTVLLFVPSTMREYCDARKSHNFFVSFDFFRLCVHHHRV